MEKIDPSKGKLIVGVMSMEGHPTTVLNGDPRIALRLLVAAAEDVREMIFQQRDKSTIEVVSADKFNPDLRGV